MAPISIEPRAGVIEAGKIQIFNVDFSPVEVSQYQGRLVCRYSLLPFVDHYCHLWVGHVIRIILRLQEQNRRNVTVTDPRGAEWIRSPPACRCSSSTSVAPSFFILNQDALLGA